MQEKPAAPGVTSPLTDWKPAFSWPTSTPGC